MRLLAPPSARQVDAGLLVVRVVAGVAFTAHGAQKVFVSGLGAVAAGFAQMGLPLAGLLGPAVGLVEFLGGLALILGLLTRPVAAALAVVMLGAVFLVHLPAGYFLPNGYEFAFTLMGAAVALAITGAGGFSLDSRLGAEGRARADSRAGARRAT